jgi:methyltransferase
MTLSSAILLFVTVQRLLELILARRNTRRLLANGAREAGREHYPVMVALHAAWLVTLWALGWNRPVNLILLGLFALMQMLRIWVIASLGGRWTTRIIVAPNAPLVATGPFRFVRHPNYCIVTAEIALLPLALGLPLTAMIFSILNAAMLTVRITCENRALTHAARSSAGLIQPAT